MYQRMGSVNSVGNKVISLADKISAAAQRVSGAVKGAAVGAETAPAHPYLMPVLIGVGVFLALHLAMKMTRGKR